MVEMIQDEYGRTIAITHGARYIMEHRLLPEMLYENGMGFMAAAVSKDDVINRVFLDVMKQEGVENPYGDSPISVNPFKVGTVLVACFIFPKPEDEPLCYMSFALFDTDTQKAGYFCVERGETDEDPAFLCSWTREGEHCNHGGCMKEATEELIEKILNMFIDLDEDSISSEDEKED